MPWNGRDKKRCSQGGDQDSPDRRPNEIVRHCAIPYDEGVKINHEAAMAIVVNTDNFMHIAKSPRIHDAREYASNELADILKVIKESKNKKTPRR